MRMRPALLLFLFPIAALVAAQKTPDLPATDTGSAVGHVIWKYDTSG